MDKKIDNLHYSISRSAQQLFHQEEENLEEQYQSDTMAEEQCQQQPHEELIEDFIGLSEGLFESSDTCAVVFPREKKEEILPFITEEGSETKAVEEPKKNVLQPIPTKLNPTATAQLKNNPLPVAPSADQVYILPTPVENPKPTAPTPKTHASPSLLVQNIRKLMATGRAFSTTSNTRAAAYISWHSGWIGCGFGFGAPEPRHF